METTDIEVREVLPYRTVPAQALQPRPLPCKELPEPVKENEEQQPTRKQMKFVEYYCRGYSPLKAADMAGYSRSMVEQHFGQILNSPIVKREIAKRMKEIFAERLETQEIINDLRLQAKANIRDFVTADEANPNKVFYDLRNLTREQWQQIRSITYDSDGRLRVNLHDQQRANEMLLKIKSLMRDEDADRPLTVEALDQIIKDEIERKRNITINNTQINITQQVSE